MRDSVTIRVPATAANLGPGFDCLGMTLNIYNTVTITRSQHFCINISGEAMLTAGKRTGIKSKVHIAELSANGARNMEEKPESSRKFCAD